MPQTGLRHAPYGDRHRGQKQLGSHPRHSHRHSPPAAGQSPSIRDIAVQRGREYEQHRADRMDASAPVCQQQRMSQFMATLHHRQRRQPPQIRGERRRDSRRRRPVGERPVGHKPAGHWPVGHWPVGGLSGEPSLGPRQFACQLFAVSRRDERRPTYRDERHPHDGRREQPTDGPR